MTETGPTTYRLDRATALITTGVCLVGAGIAVLVASVLVGRDDPLRWLGVVAGGIAVVLLVAAARFAVVPPVVLRLDAEGFASRARSTSERLAGRWRDVDDVTAGEGVLRLTTSDGRTQQFAMRLVGSAERVRLVHEVYERLNAAHGYRRFE